MAEHSIILSEEAVGAVTRETASATGLPNRAYTSEEFFQCERDQLFAKTWTCIGNACSVPDPGDVKPVRFLGIPLVMVRNKRRELRVFHNVCSHRGNELVWEACRVGTVIRCPYHAWAYNLDGVLQATPNIGGTGVHEIASLDKRQRGLHEVRSAVWMGLVFVNLSKEAEPFDTFIAPLQERIDRFATRDQFAELQPASTHGSLTIEFSGNWKLCIENNLESYHLPWVHPDLNSISKLEDHYHFYGDGLFAGQGSHKYDHTRENSATFPSFSDWPQQVAEYPTLFPNVFLGLHCDHYWTRIIEPVSASHTLDHLQIYYLR